MPFSVFRMSLPCNTHDTSPPLHSTPPYNGTPGGIYIYIIYIYICIYFLVFHRHSTTAGTLNTTPPPGVLPKNTVKLRSDHPAPGGLHSSTTPHRYGYRYEDGGNYCAPSQSGDRVCGSASTGTCCRRASSEDHVFFFFPGSPGLLVLMLPFLRWLKPGRHPQLLANR